LTSGSGFEKTAASLALRSVLAELSTIPRNSFVLLDEVTGRVAEENLENIHTLLNKITKNYDFIFIISHLDAVKMWANSNVVVEKTDNISRIKLEKK
jgi:DNA repair exonuclease SbcCD ATPase subunit